MAGLPPEQWVVVPLTSSSGSEGKLTERILVELFGADIPSFTALIL